MDLDHLFDYLMHYGPRFRRRLFFKSSYHRKYRYVYVLLHAWEWVLLWALAVGLTHWNPWVLGAFLGWLQHMALDHIMNRPRHFGYFLLGRWRQGFLHDVCFPRRDSFLNRKSQKPTGP